MESKKHGTCLIVVPHPDDELNVAGQLIPSLVKRGWSLRVLFATNGDYIARQGIVRMREALAALQVLGVGEESVVFLGYGDGWKGAAHLYNSPGTVPLESMGGRNETYGLPEHPEYRLRKSGHHSIYTRANYKKDLKEAVLEIGADVLVSVDFDLHPDHRCLSLMLEEVLGEIFREREDYRPAVLKKFAYAGVWMGPRDYFRFPARATCPPSRGSVNDPAFLLDVPSYSWEGRLRFEVPAETRAARLWKNPVYRAARAYRSQSARLRADRICNADAVYWPRRTDGLSYRAEFRASSGNPSYLNDFKLIDCPDVLRTGPGIFRDCVWTPDPGDPERAVTVSFPRPANVSRLVLYENCSPEDHILNGTVRFESGFLVRTGPLDPTGAGTKLDFDLQRGVRSLTFRITEASGRRPGLTEFEIYEDAGEPEYGRIARIYDPNARWEESRFSGAAARCMSALILNFQILVYKIKLRIKKIIRKTA